MKALQYSSRYSYTSPRWPTPYHLPHTPCLVPILHSVLFVMHPRCRRAVSYTGCLPHYNEPTLVLNCALVNDYFPSIYSFADIHGKNHLSFDGKFIMFYIFVGKTWKTTVNLFISLIDWYENIIHIYFMSGSHFYPWCWGKLEHDRELLYLFYYTILVLYLEFDHFTVL